MELFLLHWVPRRLTARDEVLQRAPEVLRAWVPWAAARSGLPKFLVEEALEMIDELCDEALEALSDQSRWGPAKRFAMRMLAGGVDPADGDAVDVWHRPVSDDGLLGAAEPAKARAIAKPRGLAGLRRARDAAGLGH